MENWQLGVIKKNLPQLIKITMCNRSLLAYLMVEDIISEEEKNEIDGSQNITYKADHLYKVIITRKNAYQHLVKACQETRQTGVVQILKDGELDHNLKICSNQQDNFGRTGLHRALMSGESLNAIQKRISVEADYNLNDNANDGVMHFAVRGGNKEVISYLVSLKQNINTMNAVGESPLHQVIFTKTRDYVGMTNFLLDIGADLFAKDKNRNTVAHSFTTAEHISTDQLQIWVKAMIDNGHGNIFAICGQFGRTPLQSAMPLRDLDFGIIKMILESSKVGIDQIDEHGCTLLLLALNFGRSMQTIKSLIKLGAKINIKDKSGNGPLYFAVIGGNAEANRYLMSHGLYVNEVNSFGHTPLYYVKDTRLKNYTELTNLLLVNGANLYSKNQHGNTLAHELSLTENVTCENFKVWVSAMIKNGHGQLFTTRRFLGRTPLHSSMQRRDLDLETMKLMVDFGKLDINQPDDQGNTILHLALSFGRTLDTIRNLGRLGADWKRKAMHGCSVMHCAVRGSNQEAILYFKSLGADVNATDKYDRTPLHYVCIARNKDYLGLTKFLLENGANLKARDKLGRTLDQIMPDWISAEEYRV